jgi:hypothetical protein
MRRGDAMGREATIDCEVIGIFAKLTRNSE